MALERERVTQLESGLHPLVLALMILSVFWLVLFAWVVFGGSRVGAILLVVVAFTAIGFLAVPVVFWLLSRQHRRQGHRIPFSVWVRREFALPEGPVRARDAAINALIAPAAAALTLTLTALAAWYAGAGS